MSGSRDHLVCTPFYADKATCKNLWSCFDIIGIKYCEPGGFRKSLTSEQHHIGMANRQDMCAAVRAAATAVMHGSLCLHQGVRQELSQPVVARMVPSRTTSAVVWQVLWSLGGRHQPYPPGLVRPGRSCWRHPYIQGLFS
jgi:hypothetical protein